MDTTLEIDGMHCASCVHAIEKALAKVSGVQKSEVNLVTEKAQVTSDDSVSVDTLISAVKNAGYEAFEAE